MIYKVFINVMKFLTLTFGYEAALTIKDSIDSMSWTILGMVILTWIFSAFTLECRKNANLDPEIAITRFVYEGHRCFMINPQTKAGAVRSLVGFLYLKIFHQETIRVDTSKYITLTLSIIFILLFLLGWVLSIWHYFPDGARLSPLKGIWKYIF